MKKTIGFLCLFFIVITSAVGQNIEKSYTSSFRGDDAVYFIYPMKKYVSSDSPKELEYDITYNHSEDSVTYNFTFFYKQPFQLDFVSLESADNKITVPATILFIEPKKNLWRHRISLKIPYSAVKELYSSSVPLRLELEKGGETISFEIKQKDWSQQSVIISKIIQVIELNRKK